MATPDAVTALPPGFELDDAPNPLDDGPGAIAAAAENQPPSLRVDPSMQLRSPAQPEATTAAALPDGFELDPPQTAPTPASPLPDGFALDAPPVGSKPRITIDAATGKASLVMPTPAVKPPQATSLFGPAGATGQKDIDTALDNYLAGLGDVVVAQPMHAAAALKHAITGETIPPPSTTNAFSGDVMDQTAAADEVLAAAKGAPIGGLQGVLEQKIPQTVGNLVGLAPASVGGVLPVAAQLGLGSASDKYVAAKQAGATDAQADEAAGVSGAINAGAGLVMGPVAGLARAGAGGPLADAIAAGARPTLAQAAKFVGLDAAGNSAVMAGSQLATNAADQTIYDPTRPLTQGVGEAALTGLGFGAMHAPEVVSALRDGMTVPENTTTLQTQQQEMVAGKRDAMVFPTGTKELPVPDGFARLKTADGVFHFNPDEIEPAQIQSAVKDGTLGDILDYGISSKPDVTQPHTAVVRRDANGNEIEAVATDQAHLAQVLAKQGERAEPGQTISTESPADVIAKRQQTNGSMTPEEFTAQQEQVARQKRLDYYRQKQTVLTPDREQQISQESATAQQQAKLANAQAALDRAAQLKADQEKQAQAKQDVLQNAPQDTVADLAHGGDADAHNELMARMDGNDLEYNIALKDAASRANDRAEAAKAQQQYEDESREFAGDNPGQGAELLDAVKQAGGLPHMDAGGLGLTGELDTLREGAPKGLFSRQQKRDLDTIRENVNEKGGFDFETPDDLLNAVGNRLRTNKPMHGNVRLATEAEAQLRFAREDEEGHNNEDEQTADHQSDRGHGRPVGGVHERHADGAISEVSDAGAEEAGSGLGSSGQEAARRHLNETLAAMSPGDRFILEDGFRQAHKELSALSPQELRDLIAIQRKPYPIKGESAAEMAKGSIHLITAYDEKYRDADMIRLRKEFFKKHLDADEVDIGELPHFEDTNSVVDSTGESNHYREWDDEQKELVTQPVKHITNKLDEAKAAPEAYPKTESFRELGVHGRLLENADLAKFDSEFGKDNWFIKPWHPDDASSGKGVFSAEQVHKAFRGEETFYNKGDNPHNEKDTPLTKEIVQAVARPDYYMVQAKHDVAGATPEMRAKGFTIVSGEKRVHHVTDLAGNVHSVIGATFRRGLEPGDTSLHLHHYDTPETLAAEAAAQKGIEEYPEEERRGSAFGSDMVPLSNKNYGLVESNPAVISGHEDLRTGIETSNFASGAYDYPTYQDAHVNAIRGELPTHVKFAREIMARLAGLPEDTDLKTIATKFSQERRFDRRDDLRSGGSAGREETDAERIPSVQASNEINKLVDDFKNGQLNHDEFYSGLTTLAQKLADVSEQKKDKAARAEVQRGADMVREKLINARRRGFIPPEQSELALWLLDKNPNLAQDLAMSVRKKDEAGVAGYYDPAKTMISLFKGNKSRETAVHEILHHAERMMPEAIQQPIELEWAKAWSKAFADSTERDDRPEMEAMKNILVSQRGKNARPMTLSRERWEAANGREAFTGKKPDARFDDAYKAYAEKQRTPAAKQVIEAFTDGTLNYREHYQLTSPSEFWAVNGARIMGQRFDASRSWIGAAKQWLSELVEKVKGLLHLDTDAPVIRGLNDVLKAGGDFKAEGMIDRSDRAAFHSKEGTAEDYANERIAQIDESLEKKTAELQRLRDRGAAKADMATVKRYIDQLKFEKADLIAERDDNDPAARENDMAGDPPPRRPSGFHGQPVPHDPGTPEDVGTIHPWRLTKAFMGTKDIFNRTKGLEFLGKAIERHVDRARMYQGELTQPFRDWAKEYERTEKKTAYKEFEKYWAAKDAKDEHAETFYQSASPAGRALIDTWREQANRMGVANMVNNLVVHDSTLNGGKGGFRAVGMVKDYFPRTLRQDVWDALNAPNKFPKKFAEVMRELEAAGFGKTKEDALRMINTQFSRESTNDHFGNIEKARLLKLPSSLYDYSFDAARRYIMRWAERTSQIEAYGQKVGAHGKDLFDEAQDLVNEMKLTGRMDKNKADATGQYINAVRDRAYGKNYRGPIWDAMRNLNALATGLHLGNPANVAMNIQNGLGYNMNHFGFWAGMKGLADLHVAGKFFDSIDDAREKGILQDDLMHMAQDAEAAGASSREWTQKFAAGALKYSGYNASEYYVRAIGLTTAKAYLRQALKAWDKNPDRGAGLQYQAWFQRNGFDPRTLMMEQGTGPATDAYLRGSINDVHGGYRFDQTPAWMDTPTGRFLFKYQKWGSQMARNAYMNVFEPAIKGTPVKRVIDGKMTTTNVRTLAPLVRFAVTAGLIGWSYDQMVEWLWGRADQTASFSEIGKTLEQNFNRGLQLIADKYITHVINSGALGTFGNYAQTMRDFTARSRFKNPLSPPALGVLTPSMELAMRLMEQHKLSAGDLENWLSGTSSQFRVAEEGGSRLLGAIDPAFAKQSTELRREDISWLRTVTQRYAAEVGLDSGNRLQAQRIGKTPDSPYKDAIRDALLTGDRSDAAKEVQAYLATKSPDVRRAALDSLQQTIRSGQPLKVGTSNSEATQQLFLQWAQQRLSAQDLARIRDIDQTYQNTAMSLGLMRPEQTPRAMSERDEAILHLLRAH